MGGQTGLGMSSQRGGKLALLLNVLGRINLADFASHAKISNFTDTRFVYQHILQLDVAVDIAHDIMEVLETPHDLPEHHAGVIVWKGGATVALENIKQGASRAILGNEVIGVEGVIGFKEGKNVLMMKRRPNLCFMIKALRFRFWIWLAGYVRATYDLYGDDISTRGSSGTDCGETATADDGSKYVPSYGLTLIVWKSDWSIDVWAEGGEE